MHSTYHVDVDELNNSFLEAIKTLFKNKTVVISISSENDETDYLTKSVSNKQHLLKSIHDIEKGKGVKINLEDFIKKYEKKIRSAQRNS